MTYSNAFNIASKLSNANTPAAVLLRIKMKETGRRATFLIMRYGDPRQWRRAPKPVDERVQRSQLTAKRMTKIAVKKPIKMDFVRKGKRLRFTRKTKDWRRIVKTRPCVLEHAMTGRVVKAPSIVAFCAKARLKHSKYHITPILDGERVTHKGWYRPDFLDGKLALKDIYGNAYQMTVREWIRRGQSGVQAYRLLSGKTRSEVGSRIMLASTEVTSPLRPRDCHTVQVKLTDGKRVFTGTSIHGAAQAAGHSQAGALYQVAYGFRDEARGLRVKSVKMAKKRVLV